jgi:hypothetical protein
MALFVLAWNALVDLRLNYFGNMVKPNYSQVLGCTFREASAIKVQKMGISVWAIDPNKRFL